MVAYNNATDPATYLEPNPDDQTKSDHHQREASLSYRKIDAGRSNAPSSSIVSIGAG